MHQALFNGHRVIQFAVLGGKNGSLFRGTHLILSNAVDGHLLTAMTGVVCPVYRPIYEVNLRLNGMGIATILWVHTYCEIWSWCTALLSQKTS